MRVADNNQQLWWVNCQHSLNNTCIYYYWYFYIFTLMMLSYTAELMKLTDDYDFALRFDWN